MKKAIVIGSSRGIGKAIAESLNSLDIDVVTTSKQDIDTSNLQSVKEFSQKNHTADILVLNTGGPPMMDFNKITEDDWNRYHNQLFVGFCTILQQISVNDNGYIFVITSNVIKEPNSKLIISSAYRSAFSSVFKILSKEYAKTLPMKRLGNPEEIGNFVKSIIENDIKYLSGSVINFDGANSNFIF